jgi:hypothetical protein
MNPFVLASDELVLPARADRVRADLDALIGGGFDFDGRHYKLFGGRIGSRFSLSLGMPVLGGGAPVVRGRVHEDGMSTRLSLTAGARYEAIALAGFWMLITVAGGGYQLYLQTGRVLAGQAPWSAVAEVLPGIGIMAGICALGIALWRKRSAGPARALIDVIRQHLISGDEDAADRRVPAAPIH